MSLTRLYNSYADQMASQYSLVWESIPYSNGYDPGELEIRMDQSFPIPENVHATYDVFFQGLKRTRQAPLDETAKDFTIPFRIDQDWGLYNAFAKWKAGTFDPETGAIGDDKESRTNLYVFFYGPNKEIKKTVIFEGVQLRSLKIADPDHASTDPLRFDAGFNFIRYNDTSDILG